MRPAKAGGPRREGEDDPQAEGGRQDPHKDRFPPGSSKPTRSMSTRRHATIQLLRLPQGPHGSTSSSRPPTGCIPPLTLSMGLAATGTSA